MGKLVPNWDGPFSTWPGLDAIIPRKSFDWRNHGIVLESEKMRHSWEINCKSFFLLYIHKPADGHNWLDLRTMVLGRAICSCGTSVEVAAHHFSFLSDGLPYIIWLEFTDGPSATSSKSPVLSSLHCVDLGSWICQMNLSRTHACLKIKPHEVRMRAR